MTTRWREVPLGEVGAMQDGPFGSNLKSSHYVDDGIRVVRLQNIGVGHFEDNDRAFISEDHFSRLKKHACMPGDVLIATIGDPNVRACQLPGKVPVALNKADCIRLRSEDGKVEPRYVVHAINSTWFQERVSLLVHGQTRGRVNLGQLRESTIPVPPLEEQRRIADVLDRADALRAQRRAALALLDTLTQTIFLDMFGDPATNPKGWPLARLGDLAVQMQDGPFGSNLKSSHYVETGVRVIRLQNIGLGTFLDADKAFVTQDHFSRLIKHRCRPGDVLIATIGDPNVRACIQPPAIKVALNKADCIQMRCDGRLALPQYVVGAIGSPGVQADLAGLAHGQTRLRVSLGQLRRQAIANPPIELQREFAEKAAAVDALKDHHRAALAELDELFASLQQRAFRGDL